MTLNNDQILMVLLLIEHSQLPEPELSEAWDLHRAIELTQGKHMTTINSWNSVDGGTRHVIETNQSTNQPTCDQCDCVKGCQSNPLRCPNLPATQPIEQSLQFCNGCGEGYVGFCRGNSSTCPMTQPIKQGEAK